MRVLCFFIVVLALVSCSNESTNEVKISTPKKKWVCDSITETWIDTLGVEHMKTTSECDSIEITK